MRRICVKIPAFLYSYYSVFSVAGLASASVFTSVIPTKMLRDKIAAVVEANADAKTIIHGSDSNCSNNAPKNICPTAFPPANKQTTVFGITAQTSMLMRLRR